MSCFLCPMGLLQVDQLPPPPLAERLFQEATRASSTKKLESRLCPCWLGGPVWVPCYLYLQLIFVGILSL